ncbi:flagellar hook-length control protein FliK [Sinomonas sp. JGH33]|uniref:Flagellar hook-length control protein FliK n=1 Tax=Sinomonas terricola TaxID=3110330 RepID=A0ABU5TCH6_9MICC|nr:flagellar hook-length control protein FliK [Sinomonas sp. JGH33]MEA5457151.1 flagellar hook-length control protein FliK [Sinomonas sp. JGH33]
MTSMTVAPPVAQPAGSSGSAAGSASGRDSAGAFAAALAGMDAGSLARGRGADGAAPRHDRVRPEGARADTTDDDGAATAPSDAQDPLLVASCAGLVPRLDANGGGGEPTPGSASALVAAGGPGLPGAGVMRTELPGQEGTGSRVPDPSGPFPGAVGAAGLSTAGVMVGDAVAAGGIGVDDGAASPASGTGTLGSVGLGPGAVPRGQEGADAVGSAGAGGGSAVHGAGASAGGSAALGTGAGAGGLDPAAPGGAGAAGGVGAAGGARALIPAGADRVAGPPGAAGIPAGSVAPPASGSDWQPALAAGAASGRRETASSADAPQAPSAGLPPSFAPPAPYATRGAVVLEAAQGVPVPAPPSFAPQLAKPLFTLTAAAPGEHVMIVKVTPEDLGPVTVQAHIGAGGVRVELFAPTDAGRAAVQAALPELRRDLASSGIGASLDLSSRSTPQDSGAGGQRGSGGTADRGTQHGRQTAGVSLARLVGARASPAPPGSHDTGLDILA